MVGLMYVHCERHASQTSILVDLSGHGCWFGDRGMYVSTIGIHCIASCQQPANRNSYIRH